MKKNIAFQMFLTALFSFTVFFGCTGEESGHVSGIGNEDMKLQSESPNELGEKEEITEKSFTILDKKHTLDTLKDEGYTIDASIIYVTLTNKASLNSKEYTPEDFPEILLDSIEASGPLTHELVLKQLAAQRTGDWRELENHIRNGMLIDLETYHRLLIFTLTGKNTENVIAAINLLEKRNDVQKAEPQLRLLPQKLGTYPGLSAETEKQIKHDYLYNYLDEYAQTYLTIDDIRFDYYFGNYNGCVVIAFLGDATVNTFITAAGVVFGFPLSAVMHAWKQGENSTNGYFYKVQEAYDLGFLTLDEIIAMNIQHNGQVMYAEDYKGPDLHL